MLQGAASALKAVCEVSIEEQDVVPRRSVNYILNVLTPRFIKNFKEASTQIRYGVVRMYNNQGPKVLLQRQNSIDLCVFRAYKKYPVSTGQHIFIMLVSFER